MKLKTTLALCGFLAAASTSQATLVSVLNPLGRTIVSTTTGGNFISITDLQALITSTGNTVKAGVFDNEGGSAAGNITTAEPGYATPDFTITGATRAGRSDANPLNAGAQSSGGKFGLVNGSETWNLTAEVVGEYVTHFGAVFGQYRIGADLLSITATFTDNSTAVFTSTTSAPTVNVAPVTPVNTTYEFVGFQAPAGLGIRSIAISETTTGDWVAWDDMSFVVAVPVPEPGAAACSAFAGLLLLTRRRRA